MEIVENSVMLTYDEFRILLYSLGFRKCEGVYMPEKEFSEEDILRALNKLEKDELLKIGEGMPQAEALPLVFKEEKEDGSADKPLQNEEFYIRSDILRMLRIIGKPAACSTLETNEGGHVFCYFSEDGIVTSTRTPGRRESLRLRYFDTDEFDRWEKTMEGDYDDSTDC